MVEHKNNTILTFHDNLLADLYSLTLDGVYYKKIDSEEYLVNEIRGRNYQIGLQVKIPRELLTVNGNIIDYNNTSVERKKEIMDTLKDRLFFSNAEILLANILFDNYLSDKINCDISFKEIESHYRKYHKSTRIQITDFNFKRYVFIINQLAKKEMFLITKANFRDKKYSVNNLSFKQPFLTIFDYFQYEKNNMIFTYSFGMFGDVLKLSRRYSQIIPSIAYSCRLNQCMLHSVYYFIGREIFVRKWKIYKSHNLNSCKSFQLDINKLMKYIHYDTLTNNAKGYSVLSKLNGYKNQPNKNRTYRMFVKYVLTTLKEMKKNQIIYDYDVNYDYTESENFIKKYESEYDLNLNLTHELKIDDVGQDVDVSFLIYLEPIIY